MARLRICGFSNFLRPGRAWWLLILILAVACRAPFSTPGPPTPDPFPALIALGDARAAERERTAAEVAYRQAAATRPQDPAPYLRLAHLYREWNRPEEGLTALAGAEARGADRREVLALRAALYAAQGDWEQVVKWGEQAAALGDDPTTLHLLAQGYLWLGQEEAARAMYGRLVEINPADTEARERLGLLMGLADPTAARPHLQAAATPLAADVAAALEETDLARRLARIGQVCLVRGEPVLAALALERATEQNPDLAEAHALLGHALAQIGRSESARFYLETAAREAPDSPLTRSLLGLFYLQQGDLTAARPHLEAAYDLDPQNPAFALYLANLYANLGQYAVADIWLAEATRLAPQDPTVWEAVARFYVERLPGDRRGVEAARILARLASGQAKAHHLLGRALLLTGDLAGAEASLQKALELAPDMAVAHADLGHLYALQNRWDRARVEFRRALDLNTDPRLREEVEGIEGNEKLGR